MAKLRAKLALKISIIPYKGIRFLAITRPFLSNRAEFFMVTQETIIYQLVINHDFDAFLGKYHMFGGKGLGLQDPSNKLAH